MNPHQSHIVAFFMGIIMVSPLQAAHSARSVDLVVYGGTASGVMTAYSASREGLTVVLLEPGAHLGGMVTGGLSDTDLGHYTIIGGYARDFYMKAAAHYGLQNLDSPRNWLSEPHIDEAIFRDMLKDSGVAVYFHERLRENKGVVLAGKQIVSITTADGKHWRAQVFADCTYEGDLMAKSGVSYTWGRESSKEYGEDLAGVRGNTPRHQFGWPISAYDEHHRLLPEIDPGPLAPPGSGDKKVQAYNFRLILTNDPANRLPFPRPKVDDRSRFVLLEQFINEFQQHVGRPPSLHDVLGGPHMIPNHKADFNNGGAVSTDYIGHSWKYPEGSYAEKAAAC
jgi:hypothetical protein